ncbi:peptidoglycan editing factor PgeF [Noviherbaspirillum massiliense]|uniref:peptidoglycan editing factor PgeF n=1 Tax=Noviherbaspirillum massiliense TaxID=1465823 RepID=UPI00031ED65F|nr:peptidoglycan editing factor PgeF [Noviherbaspirillum massiliense]
MDIIVPDWPCAPANIGALSTLRSGGFSLPPYDDGLGDGGLNLGTHVGDRPEHVHQNRALLRSVLPAEPAWLSQVHGTTVLDAAGVKDAPEADASVSTQRGVVCVIQTADCLPVLLCDSTGTTVGAAHAGWRGLANGVLENTIGMMRRAGAGQIFAWLGPAIGPDQFEVGEDVLDCFRKQDPAFRGAFKPIPAQPGKFLADLYLLARMRLNSAGVAKVHGGGFCTVTDARRFYSYRREKTTGRMASLIWIK